MIRINLLPYRAERRQKQILQHLGAALGALALAVLISVTMHWMATSKLSDLQDEFGRLQAQNHALMKEIGKIKDLDKLRADVERKLKLVDQLQRGRFRSLNTFVELAKVIPENVWLTSVTDTGKEIKLTGLGESNNAVANFMRALDNSPIFSNVRLQVITRTQVGAVAVRQFDLVFDRVEAKAKDSAAADGNGGQS
jgi:type IV pilus assembly protein PilN